ncbi:UNVERIFIED_CONTAM: hypothetical protein HHA_235460 [Hammondia hammondi]|eukprot:XP_008885553.1 hypothetical protein HHA_235460 [Hammondia hammondi]
MTFQPTLQRRLHSALEFHPVTSCFLLRHEPRLSPCFFFSFPRGCLFAASPFSLHRPPLSLREKNHVISPLARGHFFRRSNLIELYALQLRELAC